MAAKKAAEGLHRYRVTAESPDGEWLEYVVDAPEVAVNHKGDLFFGTIQDNHEIIEYEVAIFAEGFWRSVIKES